MASQASNSNIYTQMNQSNTYSSILKSTNYPNKQQAIVLQKVENVELHEYLLALETITDLKNITDAYPTSFNRIFVFLKTKELADEIVNNHTHILVKDQIVSIRKLINPAKRLTISTPAYIPNEVLLEKFVELNIKVVSPITHIKLGNNPKLAHMNSGRRQCYVAPEEDIEIPDSFLINYENENCRIFLSSEKCPFCNRYGHTVNRCRELMENNAAQARTQAETISNKEAENLDQTQLTNKITADEVFRTPNPPSAIVAHDGELFSPPTTSADDSQHTSGFKRFWSQQSDQSPTDIIKSLDDTDDSTTTSVSVRHPNKKKIPSAEIKKRNALITKGLEPLKNIIVNTTPNSYPLNYQEYEEFILKSLYSPDPLNIARTFTLDIEGLKTMILSTKKLLKNTNLKGSFTSLVTRIDKKLKIELAESSN